MNFIADIGTQIVNLGIPSLNLPHAELILSLNLVFLLRFWEFPYFFAIDLRHVCLMQVLNMLKIDPSGIEPHTSIIRLINPVIRKFVVKDKCFASYVCNLFLGNNKPAKQLLISQLIVVRQFILLGCITDSNTRKVMKSIRLDRLYDN